METAAFSYSGTELDAMAQAQNYHNWIRKLTSPYLGNRVVEVGAGLGNFAAVLLRETVVSELLLVEPAENLFPHLAQRFAAEPRVKTVKGYLSDHATFCGMDSVIAVNVIEHIRDDVEFLRLAFRALAPGGAVILFAPALTALYGTLDESFEHYRRYSKPELVDKLVQTGFHLEKIRYLNFPGIFTWFLAGRIFRRKTLQGAQVRLYDRWMVPWVSKAEQWWAPPVGQSLLAVGRKPAASDRNAEIRN